MSNHKTIKELEPYISLAGSIGGGGVIGTYFADPLIAMLGKPLAAIVGAILCLLLYAAVKKIFFEPKENPIHESKNIGVEIKKFSNAFLNKLTEKDIFSAFGGRYDEALRVFIFEHKNLVNAPINNYYKHWGEPFLKVYVDFLPHFVEEIKCQFMLGWNEHEGSYFKGTISIGGDEYDKQIKISDMNEKKIFDVTFKIQKDAMQRRFISFFVTPDENMTQDPILRNKIGELAIINLQLVSFKV